MPELPPTGNPPTPVFPPPASEKTGCVPAYVARASRFWLFRRLGSKSSVAGPAHPAQPRLPKSPFTLPTRPIDQFVQPQFPALSHGLAQPYAAAAAERRRRARGAGVPAWGGRRSAGAGARRVAPRQPAGEWCGAARWARDGAGAGAGRGGAAGASNDRRTDGGRAALLPGAGRRSSLAQAALLPAPERLALARPTAGPSGLCCWAGRGRRPAANTGRGPLEAHTAGGLQWETGTMVVGLPRLCVRDAEAKPRTAGGQQWETGSRALALALKGT